MTSELSPSLSIEPTAAAPRRLGRYRLHRPIASGGMASVHLANTDTKEGFTKILAVKVIHEHLASDPSFVEMFLDEARIAAQIEHANVCSVFDFGECDGSYYIAMEYMIGETFASLRDLMRKREYAPEWPRVVATLIAQACEGLHAAHSLCGANGERVGLVHRDISPQNLFVTFSGIAKVMDFGIARAEGRSHHTAPGTIKGKFAYLAPEQLHSADDVDRRADVWALGVTLWEMLTLRPLFRRSGPAETVTAVLNRVVEAPSSLRPEVNHGLDEVVLRALTRDRDGRIASAREFGRELADAMRSEGGLMTTVELEEWLERIYPDGRNRHSLTASITREIAEQRMTPSIESFGREGSQPSDPQILRSMVVARAPGSQSEVPVSPPTSEVTHTPTPAGSLSSLVGSPLDAQARRSTYSAQSLVIFACFAGSAAIAFVMRPSPPRDVVHVVEAPALSGPATSEAAARRDVETVPVAGDAVAASTIEDDSGDVSSTTDHSAAGRRRGRGAPSASGSATPVTAAAPRASNPEPPPPEADRTAPVTDSTPGAETSRPTEARMLERNPYLRGE